MSATNSQRGKMTPEEWVVARRAQIDKKKNKVLRKAAYWLTDYANCFRTSTEPGARKFAEKLRKISKECRSHGR